MQLTCPRCRHALEFSGERPSFCAYCGTALGGAPPGETADFDPEATLPPRAPGEAGATDASVPEVVGGYRLLRTLGGGGMGTVYEAEEVASGRRVALKLIAPEYARSADAVERFRQEGRLASGIAHPRCVFVLAADEQAGRPYIVMELMPGSTLDDLVRDMGALPPEKALAAILDVIEGLEEAHRHGVIHRDVKPSNCFLDADGRVKVGDFGLSKSLVNSPHLTRTGSFLGTPLYASPEQIRGEPLDPQTDVYSVAATLYFLLTGRAPFQSSDPAATLARIVSDPAPSLRTLRPDLDPRLDRVILRGLERNRARRWRDLADFRAELQQFLPGRLSIGGLGIRFGASLLDYLFITVVNSVISFVVILIFGLERLLTAQYEPRVQVYNLWGLAVWVVYFGVPEGLWGTSPGKLLLRLRVRRAEDSSPPGLARGVLRAAAWTALLNMGMVTWIFLLIVLVPPGTRYDQMAYQSPVTYALLSFLPLAGYAVGIGLVLAPMRWRNGYRGLHEFLTGTRVVRLPPPVRRPALCGGRCELPLLPADGCPARLGGYAVRGALGGQAGAKVLVAHDAVLGRDVWVWLRPGTEPALSDARRQVTRTTRLRWLASGTHGDARWDAFIAPTAIPLAEVVGEHGRFAWPDVRPLLEGLTDELTQACAEGTLPESLRLEQVWVQPNGTPQLLDMALRDGVTGEAPEKATSAAEESAGARRRATALLAQVAALALEGATRRDTSGPPIRAPLPGHAADILGRLLVAWEAGRGWLKKWQAGLRDTRDRPVEVTRARRAAHLGLLSAFLLLGGGCCVFPAGWFVDMVPAMAQPAALTEEEVTLTELEQGTWRDFSVTAVGPDPLARWSALAGLQANLPLDDRLREKVARDRQEWEARREMMGAVGRQQVLIIEKSMEQQRAQFATDPRFQQGQQQLRRKYRWAAENLVRSERPPDLEAGVAAAMLVPLVAWPVLWVVWALLWRGGLSYRILGINLVRADGRPAMRLQCAWRALLVWAPVTGLLALSLWLQTRFWSGWHAGHANPWLQTLATAVWCSALLLLGGYALLALARPGRTLHDRLAGTYLVPK